MNRKKIFGILVVAALAVGATVNVMAFAKIEEDKKPSACYPGTENGDGLELMWCGNCAKATIIPSGQGTCSLW